MGGIGGIMDTYFKFKLICEYYIPLALLAIIAIGFIGLVIAAKIMDFIDGRRKDNGTDSTN